MELLIPRSEYIKYKANRGGMSKNKKLERFISWKTPAGRNMFSIHKIDERIRIAARFLLDKNFLIAGTELDKEYCEKLGKFTGAKVISNYTSSIISNPNNKEYFEPEVLFVTNVDENQNAIQEANINRIPVLAFCNTNSDVSGVDLIVPLNTSNKYAIGLSLWLILNEMRKLKKEKEIPFEEFMRKE